MAPSVLQLETKRRSFDVEKTGQVHVMIDGNGTFEIPGSKTHELPPLLVHPAAERRPPESGGHGFRAAEAEDMLAATDAARSMLEQRKFELALQLAEQYRGLVSHWLWGDSILEWIRQCEITFEREESAAEAAASGRMAARRPREFRDAPDG